MVEYIPRNERLAFRLMSGHQPSCKAHCTTPDRSFRSATVGRRDRGLYNAKASPYIKHLLMPIAKASTARHVRFERHGYPGRLT